MVQWMEKGQGLVLFIEKVFPESAKARGVCKGIDLDSRKPNQCKLPPPKKLAAQWCLPGPKVLVVATEVLWGHNGIGTRCSKPQFFNKDKRKGAKNRTRIPNFGIDRCKGAGLAHMHPRLNQKIQTSVGCKAAGLKPWHLVFFCQKFRVFPPKHDSTQRAHTKRKEHSLKEKMNTQSGQ